MMMMLMLHHQQEFDFPHPHLQQHFKNIQWVKWLFDTGICKPGGMSSLVGCC